ncbi:MAG: 30S ribosomal protein S1 [Bacteroidales bacterium]|jgi:small subunit ribosomal protein S1|nr:30S ribosomal protein S1 [Bacteroidales bacterium]
MSEDKQNLEAQEAQEVETPAAQEETKVEAAPAPVVEEAPAPEVKASITTGPDEDFDWDLFELGDETVGQNHAELEKLYEDSLSTVVEKEVIDGVVIAINKREVVVNIGSKSDGVLSFNEFRYNPDLKLGDVVEVYVENQEDKKGQLILSHKKARLLNAWDKINTSFETGEIITGFVKCRTKGGMIVDVFGIEAFLPGSQIDVKPIRDYDAYVEKTMEFKVVKINHEYKNVVVSHKALIEAELEEQKKKIIATLEKGQVLEGAVKNITSYGVFIDLGGVDGLVHITDLSWGRVNHPDEIVELDQKLNVVILDFDDEKKRIALGLKQLTPHPWDALSEELKEDDVVKGKVLVMADYGAFLEIAPGVEGLIHVSEMSWSQHLRSAQDFLKVGDLVEAKILTLDRDDRKMSLGIKQLKQDPWSGIAEKYPVQSKHSALVRNFTNFGIFVELEEGIEGLVHISDLSWTKKIYHQSEFTSVGEKLDVVVLEIDADNRRLSLGHKQLEENPWDVFESIFTEGSIHEGTIIESMDRGAVVSLPYGVEGFATPKHLVKEDGSSAKLDQKLDFKVIEFNKEGKRIIVSHSRIHEDINRAEKHATKKQTAKTTKKLSENIEKTTLGDVSGLAALKSQMEDDSKAKAEEMVKKAEKKTAPKKAAVKKAAPAKEEAKVEEVTEEPKAEATEETKE